MSIAGILSSSALTTASVLQNSFKQKQTEFQQLAQALQSGNLSSAQQVFGALTQNASGSTAIQNTQLGQDFSTLGSDLQAGNLTAAQKAYATLKQDVQNASSAGQVHHHHHGGHGAPNPTSSLFASPSDTAQVAENPIIASFFGQSPDGSSYGASSEPSSALAELAGLNVAA